jgi:hypothetical protein
VVLSVGLAHLPDSDGAVGVAVNDHSNTGWAGIPERAAIDVGHEI